MALMPEGTSPRENVAARFQIAQDGTPSVEQLDLQRTLRWRVAGLADVLNTSVADSREKSLALTHLEEALMWAGKAIFAPVDRPARKPYDGTPGNEGLFQ